MLFNSLTFLIFGLVFFLLWPLARKHRKFGWGYLTIASLVFYGWWDWRFIFLILASGLLDYFAGLGMFRWPQKRRMFLIFSIIGNVGSLAIFKYLTFLIENFNTAFSTFGVSLPVVQVALPVGISFYTFQSMSYTIDIYRGRMKPTHNVLHFFTYLAMFPQLVAGPIVRAHDLLPQLEKTRTINENDRWEGLKLITYGYVKKVVLADNLAPAVNLAFGAADPAASLPYWWIAVSMFAFQIYFDFSGYSDIARGLGRWMGYEFPVNFDHPYRSLSLREFWQRWHISLSTWFRDYLYIPLGGSRSGLWGGIRNLWIVMLVAGLWHGAAWTFVVWGGLFALFITIERLTHWPEHLAELPLGRLLTWVLMLLQVWVAWVFFRAESFGQAIEVLSAMFNLSLFSLPALPGPFIPALLALAAGALTELAQNLKLHGWILRESVVVKAVQPLYIALLLVAAIFLRGPGSAFIYFQF